MGLLGEIFSAGDSAKRKLRGLLSDPIGELGLFGTRAAEDIQNMNQLAAMAYPMLPREQIRTDTPQGRERVVEQNRARNQLADLASNMGMAAATVWHGSPHKFDRFDSSKIGTGEGAQAYGHGVYFADDRGIADVYRRKLTGVDGSPVSHPDQSLQVKIGRLQDQIKQLEQSGDASAPAMIKAYQNRIAELDGGGSLYKVDLPDEAIAKMLDWDKPLSQQAPEVQKAVKDFADLQGIENYIPKGENSPVLLRTGISGDTRGQDVYRFFGRGTNSKDAADTMRFMGIPGIRYLDGGSRGAGTGTRNYVVFPGNEGLLTILERNGMKP